MPVLPIPKIHPMHIPDGFLSVLVALAMWCIAIVVVAIALKKTQHLLNERQVPLMGVLAAAVFAGQMLNFTVLGGTSGHLLGAALVAILLGPWPAVLVMTTVVIVQALFFQDGGLLALGANLINMGVIAVFVSHAVFSLLKRLHFAEKWSLFMSGFLAGWSSVFFTSLACGFELALSGTSPANIALPAMGFIHALIGVGEGLITTSALALILASRPDLFNLDHSSKVSDRLVIFTGITFAVMLTVLTPLASSHPDGLEWVAEQHGFLAKAQDALYTLIPDYVMPGLHDSALATIAAGLLGVLIVFGTAFGIARTRRRVVVCETTRTE